MRLRHLFIVAVVVLGLVLLRSGMLLGALLGWLVGTGFFLLSLACPLFFIAMLLAPFIGFPMSQALQQGVQRLRVRRREIDQLTGRIDQLGKPHHMVELGTIYWQQGRYRRAAEWFRQALEGDATILDARYKLALCRLHEGRPEEAAELLEGVYREKPDYEYGDTYLYLARAQAQAGNVERAREVFELLLKFYPGHPEGTYRYGLLLSQAGEQAACRKRMQQVVASVKNSPDFGRRRNGPWLWKARWWLWRN